MQIESLAPCTKGVTAIMRVRHLSIQLISSLATVILLGVLIDLPQGSEVCYWK